MHTHLNLLEDNFNALQHLVHIRAPSKGLPCHDISHELLSRCVAADLVVLLQHLQRAVGVQESAPRKARHCTALHCTALHCTATVAAVSGSCGEATQGALVLRFTATCDWQTQRCED
jgi:hypothetical protein